MKEFNLGEALAGAKVVTRDGREVTQLHRFKISKVYTLYGVVDEDVCSWTAEGTSIAGCAESHDDLFMAPKKLSGFINVYSNGVTSCVYKTKELANHHACSDRIACIDLSQFEEGEGL